MSPLEITMIVISSATLLGYTIARSLAIQPTIGILSISIILVTLAHLLEPVTGRLDLIESGIDFIQRTDFRSILLDTMLPVLLFAGAMSMNANYFKKYKLTILTLAIFSTFASTAIIGYGFYYLCGFLNIDIELLHCLLFGALISPTDPVAVVALVKKSNLAPDIEAKIAGESLFNDGVGIVLFFTLYHLAFDSTATITPQGIISYFLQEAVGGCLVGVISGLFCRKLIAHDAKHNHNHIIISIFIVTGIYTLTNNLHMSGALAVVVSGLFMADFTSTSPKDYQPLKYFWESLEDVLNMVLYLLLGLEALLLPPSFGTLLIALSGIILALISRVITINIPMLLLSRYQSFEPKTKRLLIWGGLRGGLAVALTLSLPDIPQRETILIATYAVVCFTTIIQGGTISRLLKS